MLVADLYKDLPADFRVRDSRFLPVGARPVELSRDGVGMAVTGVRLERNQVL